MPHSQVKLQIANQVTYIYVYIYIYCIYNETWMMVSYWDGTVPMLRSNLQMNLYYSENNDYFAW